jgi:RNA polymerase II subunit A C-terminal domain phosphatase SSU72
MDPRRARDPRLARTDPRLQRVQSGSPAGASQSQHHSTENGVQNHSTPPPIPQANLPITPHQDGQQPQGQSPPPGHKTQPLFCVVCASNQVRRCGFLHCVPYKHHLESIDGGSLCLIVSFSTRLILTQVIQPSKAGYRVISSGTGSAVRLPGSSIDRPNIYPFGTPYHTIFEELNTKDPRL